jgi:hypothetical protein
MGENANDLVVALVALLKTDGPSTLLIFISQV